MDSLDACAVEDLLTAGGAGGGDECGFFFCLVHSFPYCGEEHHLAYRDGGLVVFFLIAERARHTATAAGYDVHIGAFEEAQHCGSLLDADQGFLVTVAVEPDVARIGLEHICGDAAFGDFSHEKLVVEQTVFRQFQRLRSQLGGHEVGIFVAERQDTRRFQANQGRFVGNKVLDQIDIAYSILFRQL